MKLLNFGQKLWGTSLSLTSRVLLPDGRTQVVKYRVEGEDTGYMVSVKLVFLLLLGMLFRCLMRRNVPVALLQIPGRSKRRRPR